MRDVDVAVVGAGVMGSATARALARAGRETIVLEQFHVGHTRGSSHGRSRIFRFSYHDERFVRMAVDALPLWRELEGEAGERLLTVTGGIDTGKALEDHATAMSASGVRYEWLDGDEALRRYPGLRLSPGAAALFQQDAGWVAADAAVRALARSATRHGAELLEGRRVRSLHPQDGGVLLETDDGSYRAAVAVVTAGSWARDLVAPLGIELPTRSTRETVAYFRVPDEEAIPSLVDWGDPALYSLRSPDQGLKVGQHQAGPTTDPDREGEVSEESVARLSAWVKERYPDADPNPHLAETCLYTIAPGDEFILERRGAVVVGSPCSGHGFKFAPLIGQRLAGLAMAAA
ncbi:MAG TPA: N-methyl-L-tryptophan oxidase [Actinomycetota bacterium]|nr:N-methyl-L-tryptophan oxidase [Actinomycetota bacterium]